MFSEKMEYYTQKSCKWFSFYINIAWPIMIVYSLLMLILAAVSWTNNSTEIIIANLYTIVGVLLSDLFVRFLDTLGLAFWFIGNATPIITNIAFLIMTSNKVVQDAMTTQATVGDAFSFVGNTVFSVLYSIVAFAFIVNGVILLIVNTVYILNRKDLFLVSEYSMIKAAREYDESL